MMYNDKVKEYFFTPQHVGTLDCARPRTVSFKTLPYSDNTIELFMECNEQHLVQAMRFKTNGPPYLVAVLECVCRQSINKHLSELVINKEELARDLDIPLTQMPILFRVQSVYSEIIIKLKGEL